MHKKLKSILLLLSILIILIAGCSPADENPVEIKPIPPMYSYIVGSWNIPEDQWEAKKDQAEAAKKILDQAIDNDTIVAYGYDKSPLHDTFWLAMSIEALHKVRVQFEKIGLTPPPPNPDTATPSVHILVSHYFNWKTIRVENAFVHVGVYKIRPDAPADAMDQLSQHFFGPVLEKALIDGLIFEWETDVYADPKDSPGTFLIAYLSEKSEDLETVKKAVQKRLEIPLADGPKLASLIDMKEIVDVDVRSYARYKKTN